VLRLACKHQLFVRSVTSDINTHAERVSAPSLRSSRSCVLSRPQRDDALWLTTLGCLVAVKVSIATHTRSHQGNTPVSATRQSLRSAQDLPRLDAIELTSGVARSMPDRRGASPTENSAQILSSPLCATSLRASIVRRGCPARRAQSVSSAICFGRVRLR
jgi:hypothetical protein